MNDKSEVIEGTVEESTENKKALQVPRETTQMAPITPTTMLNMAVKQGADIESIRELMALKREWEADEAKKAYVVAMNAFKKNPPEIFKDRHVSYTTDKGTTEYTHASLANIVKTNGQALAKHGLSHRWDMETLEGGIMVVPCVLTHKLGQSESVPMQAGADQLRRKKQYPGQGLNNHLPATLHASRCHWLGNCRYGR